ncbi:MAG: peptidoglycan-associated lipoprotein [Cryomorphaceae bacterium]|jgi:peptidoglycan-associated lipoprotein
MTNFNTMIFTKGLFTFCLAALVSVSLMAQADQFTKEADNAYANEAYFEAIDLYKKAYSKASDSEEKSRMLFQIAESYRMILDYDQQVIWYDKALKAQYDNPEAFLYLAQAYHRQGDFAQAIEYYNKYKDAAPDPLKAEIGLEQAEIAKEFRDNPSRYIVQNEILLNSAEYDFSPGWAGDDFNTIYFSSSRQGAQGMAIDLRTGESFQDIFFTTRDQKGKWSEPERLTYRINTIHNEATPRLTSAFDMMVFTRCESSKDNNKGCNVMITRKTGDQWSTAQVVEVKNDQSTENTTAGHPALTVDETHIVFASDMPGGMGGRDLWIAPFDKASMTAGTPVNLGPSINTKGDEMFPFIRQNGALYFASSGLIGMGGMDNFVAESNGENTWGNVENLGAPINSIGHDFGIIWEGDSERGYFSSDRNGGKGKDDIYSFNLPPLLFALDGVVYDKDTQQPVSEATIKVIGSDGASFEASTDAGGAFSFAEKGEERYINPETNYSIEVSKPDYLVAKDQISTVGIPESTTFLKEYFITFTAPDKAIEFPEVRYAYNKAELQVNDEVNSLDSLDFLFNVLSDNPTIIIELQAHTDSRGKDPYNKDLSQRRAESCVEYLSSKGIPTERMVAKGYGEGKLRISDKQIAALATEEEKEAAHQKNRRTEFTVLSFDYVPMEESDN